MRTKMGAQVERDCGSVACLHPAALGFRAAATALAAAAACLLIALSAPHPPRRTPSTSVCPWLAVPDAGEGGEEGGALQWSEGLTAEQAREAKAQELKGPLLTNVEMDQQYSLVWRRAKLSQQQASTNAVGGRDGWARSCLIAPSFTWASLFKI